MIPKYEHIIASHVPSIHLSLPELYYSVMLISKSAQHCVILVKIDVFNTCGAMICLYFGIVMKFFIECNVDNQK